MDEEKSLVDSVARLDSAGSEHSKSTVKLRLATDKVLTWIKNNLPVGIQLPCGCKLYPSGEFERLTLTNPPNLGTSVMEFRITIGQQHSLSQLHYFSRLIADGFLDQLSERLEEDSRQFNDTTQKIDTFLGLNDGQKTEIRRTNLSSV